MHPDLRDRGRQWTRAEWSNLAWLDRHGGEAGHCIVQAEDGAPCGCGGFGCLEQYASATAIQRMARERMGAEAPDSSHALFLMAEDGEPRALSIFGTVGHSLAIVLTGLVNTMNLPLYLLGGGVCEAWDMFAPRMFRELHVRSYVYRLTEPADQKPAAQERHKTYILRAQLGSGAGLLGACLLAYERQESASTYQENLIING
jgi:glucokinase